MKTMKKLLALVLALAMCLAMTACASGLRGSVSPAADSSSASAPAPTTTPESAPESGDGLELGSMVGGTYENAFVGIGCKLDSSWTYLSDEEILEINEIMLDSIDDGELAAKLSKKGMFYDMAATSEENSASVCVVVENLSLLYGSVLDTGSYIDIALKTLENDMSLMGMTAITCEKRSFEFCGKATDGVFAAATISSDGVEIETFERIACVKVGTYMFCFGGTTYVEDNTADILDLFYAV